MKTYYFLLILSGAVYNVCAADNTTAELASLKEKMHRAIIKVEQTQKKLWSYQVSRYENEEGDITSSIEQYSPQSSSPWFLKKINGKSPSKKQITKFVKKMQEQNYPQQQENNIQLPLRKLINSESLTLVSSDDEYVVMAFNVYIEKLGKDAMGKLQGELVYQKDKQFIEEITVWNNADFSPMFTANITDLALTFSFVNIGGAVLAKQSEMKMKGSFAYFTAINETSLDSYSDYLYQGMKKTIKTVE